MAARQIRLKPCETIGRPKGKPQRQVPP
jgi:hypothetical protein